MRQSDLSILASQPVSDQDFVGFGFAGDEHNYSQKIFRPLIEASQSYHRPMTLHAGECHCPHFVAQSIALASNAMYVTALSHEPDLLNPLLNMGSLVNSA